MQCNFIHNNKNSFIKALIRPEFFKIFICIIRNNEKTPFLTEELKFWCYRRVKIKSAKI